MHHNILNYNGQNIEQRADGYVNATQMAKIAGKDTTDWLKTGDSRLYIAAIAQKTGISGNRLVTKVSEGFPAKKSIWLHPDLAICFGRWISVEFAIWCDTHIKTLIETGSTSLDSDQIPAQTLPVRDAIDYVDASEKLETVNNLTLRELLRDALIDELTIKQGKRAIAPSKPQYTIAKVRATELGYTLTDIGNGTALGKWVAKSVPIAFQERVGKYTVNHYEINDQLDTSINTFFGLKAAFKRGE